MPNACFRIFERILDNNGGQQLSMEKAYGLLEEFCVSKGLSVTYSNFRAFKNSYYRKIHINERAGR
jgi:hypothetical protein